MKRVLLAAAAVAALTTCAHAGKLRCDMLVHQSTSMMWDFEYTAESDGRVYSASEVRVAKNGTMFSTAKTWTVNSGIEQNTTIMTYNEDSRYVMAFFYQGPNRGNASLFFGDKQIGTGRCLAPETKPAPAPAPERDWDRPTEAQDDIVPMQVEGNTQYVSVALGSHSATMTLDTGAGISSVTSSHADWMVANGEATESNGGIVCDAGGVCMHKRSIIIKTMQLGAHTLHDVEFCVQPDNAMQLLGVDVLDRIGPFKFDRPNRRLIFLGASS